MLFSKIMVVEDTPSNLRMITDMLESDGYEVIPAKDGAEAMTALATVTPDLILLDVQLPAKSGFDICREIKGEQASRNVPVIMMSGVHKDAQSQARALLNCKATGFLKKPFTRDELLSKIKAVLG